MWRRGAAAAIIWKRVGPLYVYRGPCGFTRLQKHVNFLYWGAITVALLLSAAGLYYGFVHTPDGKISGKALSAIKGVVKPEVAPSNATGTVRLKNTLIKHLDGGKLKWEVKAGGIDANENSGLSKFTSPSGKLFTDKGRMFTFNALTAVYDPDGKSLRVSGPFSGALEPGGHTISARDMLWDQGANKLTASSPGIVMDDARARADSLEIDTASRTVSLRGGVRIEIPLHREK